MPRSPVHGRRATARTTPAARGRTGIGTFTGDGGAPRSDGSSGLGERGLPCGGNPSSVTAAEIVTRLPAFGRPIGSIFTTGG